MGQMVVHIESGNIINKISVRKFFADLEDGDHILRTSRGKKRTLKQNRYWWFILLPEVQQALFNNGFSEVKTAEDAHLVIKTIFLKRKIVSPITGDEIVVPGSTANLSTVEFNNLIDDVIRWIADYTGVQIPYPNEQTEIF